MNVTPDKKKLRVYVVENHPDTLHWLRLYLEDLDHTVIEARTLAEAIAGLPTADCDLLICDIGLPDGTGWDLLRKARLKRPIYAIAMSGFGMRADNERSRTAGYRHHLVKPFKTSELDKVIAEATAERGQGRD
jgi:CheY-like chemotaxis protein